MPARGNGDLDTRPTLLAVGDGAAPTGFARVMQHVLRPLLARYQIHQIAINYRGDPHDWEWPLYPAGLGSEPHGAGRLVSLVERLHPRIVFILNDLWLIPHYLQALAKHREGLKIVVYVPIDGGPLDPDLVAPLRDVDALVVYTDYARREIETAVERHSLAGLPPVRVIPHGVDCGAFYPLPPKLLDGQAVAGRTWAKMQAFPDRADYRQSFVVFNGNRNQPRKRIDLTIKGFALFAAGKPENVKLYLHMGLEDAGWRIVSLTKRFGIHDRLVVTHAESNHPFLADSTLNLIYNACEVGINTSMGEGWGLVSFEHAATGAAQIVPAHGSCADLWQGAAEMVKPATSITLEKIQTEGQLVSPEGVAEALNRLYGDAGYLAAMSAAARANATRPEWRWGTIARRWQRLFAAMD